MEKRHRYYLLASALFIILLISGCTPTTAWLNTDYLGEKVTKSQAVDDINDYIKKDSNSKASKDLWMFKYNDNNPIIGDVWTNNAGMELLFEESYNGITSIVFAFENSGFGTYQASNVIVKQVAEIIDPIDYVLTPSNGKDMLNHIDLGGKDIQIRVMYNNNGTRIEKIALNEMGLPITLVRFSKQGGKDLEDWAYNVFLNFLKYSY